MKKLFKDYLPGFAEKKTISLKKFFKAEKILLRFKLD